MSQLSFAFQPGPAIPASSAPTTAPPPPSLEEPRETKERWREEIRAKAHLEQVLRGLIGPEVVLSLTDNRSTMISSRRRGRALYARVHQMFVEAPAEVHSALAAFLSKDRIGVREQRLLDGWIDRHKSVLTDARARDLELLPLGEVHDLAVTMHELNQRYFEGRVDAQITWTRAARNQRRSSIHLGTYSDELRLIRIHPALDQAFVPSYFVELVVYHEMLHQVHDPGGRECRRREVHSAAFRADERRFERYHEALEWERKNLKRLLRY